MDQDDYKFHNPDNEQIRESSPPPVDSLEDSYYFQYFDQHIFLAQTVG